MAKYALIGEKLGHSYSKIIHHKFFEKRNLDDTYELIEIPNNRLKEEFDRLCRVYDGINVTIPYKIDVMPFLNSISREAESIGAVNTIKFADGKAYGCNTDYFGLKSTFCVNDISIAGKKVVILGTGGVSRAAYAVCRDMGADDITFVSRTKAEKSEYSVITYDDAIVGDILVNCTPVGMYPNVDVAPLSDISETFSAVVDTIYNPDVTLLMREASQKGIKAVSGLYMLVAQAIHAQAIWKNECADEDIIQKIYKEMTSK